MNVQNKELHRIAITCIIYDKKRRFLVTKRALHKKVHPGKWHVPGGGLTTDDYINRPATYIGQWYDVIDTALKREIKEEVGVKIGKAKYLLDLTFVRPDGIPVLVLSYYAPYISGTVKLDADSVEYRWVTLARARKLDLIEGIYDELKMVDKLI